MIRNLTETERQSLCDLFAKCGDGDLLDFIHWIKRSAKEYGWSQEKVVWLMEVMPDSPVETPPAEQQPFNQWGYEPDLRDELAKE